MWFHGVSCTEVKGMRRLLFGYSCREVGVVFDTLNLVLWMNRVILLVLVLLIFVCILMRGGPIPMCEYIVHVPWDQCERSKGKLGCPWFHFTHSKQGVLLFSPMYFWLTSIPVSENSSVFASHLPLWALKVETYTYYNGQWPSLCEF